MSFENKEFCIHKFKRSDSKHRHCKICGLKQEHKGKFWVDLVEEKKETS